MRKLSDQIRAILKSCGESRYSIAKGTGISESTLSKFATGQRGLPMKTLDRLGLYLGLQVTRGKPTKGTRHVEKA